MKNYRIMNRIGIIFLIVVACITVFSVVVSNVRASSTEWVTECYGAPFYGYEYATDTITPDEIEGIGQEPEDGIYPYEGQIAPAYEYGTDEYFDSLHYTDTWNYFYDSGGWFLNYGGIPYPFDYWIGDMPDYSQYEGHV